VKRIIFALLLVCGCGPQFVEDPNAYVYVTSQYENEPPKVIYPNSKSDCKPQLDCTGKTEVECAAGLYHASEAFMKEGEELGTKELYASARATHMQALCRLYEAEIKLNRGKLKQYTDWKLATTLGLEEKIQTRIKYCQRRYRHYQWK
jgi:hypothetical protein